RGSGTEPPPTRPRDDRESGLHAAVGVAELDLRPPERDRARRRAHPLRSSATPAIRLGAGVGRLMAAVDPNARIPNNVGLSDDPKLRRALEHWLPAYTTWWKERGPATFTDCPIWLRTAISVERGGWANYDYVTLPDYRWGIFLAP